MPNANRGTPCPPTPSSNEQRKGKSVSLCPFWLSLPPRLPSAQMDGCFSSLPTLTFGAGRTQKVTVRCLNDALLILKPGSLKLQPYMYVLSACGLMMHTQVMPADRRHLQTISHVGGHNVPGSHHRLLQVGLGMTLEILDQVASPFSISIHHHPHHPDQPRSLSPTH